jgi:transcriptional regulator with XRE-family HTH domain
MKRNKETRGKWRQVVEGRLVVRSNLAQLIEQKSKRDFKTLSQYRLSVESGVSLNTVKHWLREIPSSYDNSVMSAFCEYFGCEVGDLLKAVDIEQTSTGVGQSEDPEK